MIKWLMKYLKLLESKPMNFDVIELFVMIKIDKDKFVFGQINMNFSYTDPIESFDINVSDVEFSILAEINNKEELVSFFIQFEIDFTDFITLKEYEYLSTANFSRNGLKKIQKVTKHQQIWINEAWSDLITPEKRTGAGEEII